MSNYVLTEEIRAKWQPVVEHKTMPEIKDNYRKLVTTVVLENQHRAFAQAQGLHESAVSTNPVNITGGTQLGGTSTMANFDPVLISLVRRSTPNMMHFDIAGVQPMTGPTGLIFAIRARYTNPSGTEALFNEADTDFSGTGTHAGGSDGFQTGTIDFNGDGDVTDANEVFTSTAYGTGMNVADAEKLGSDAMGAGSFAEMSFSIEKTSVVAKTRAMKAQYTTELAQDLRAIHGLDAEAELANILTTEVLAEQNRELIRTVNVCAQLSGPIDRRAASATYNTYKGFFDMSEMTGVGTGGDAQGRWLVERFKSLLFQIEIECNHVAKFTRRGRGNFVITSSNVASALSMAGILDHAPAMQTNLQVDDTGNLFAGVLNGRIKVYVDPFATRDYVTVGYRGATQYDAGVFFCPYVPLEMVRAVGENNFQPRIGFKTRYGVVANPFATIVAGGAIGGQTGLGAGQNIYYRKFLVTNLVYA